MRYKSVNKSEPNSVFKIGGTKQCNTENLFMLVRRPLVTFMAEKIGHLVKQLPE